MSAEATPRPWTMTLRGATIVGSDGSVVARLPPPDRDLLQDDWTVAELRRIANAALIADAPRLARMADAGEELKGAGQSLLPPGDRAVRELQALGKGTSVSGTVKKHALELAGRIARLHAAINAYEQASRGGDEA